TGASSVQAEAQRDVDALRKEIAEIRKERKAVANEIRKLKKESPDVDRSDLEAKLKKISAEIKTKQKALKQTQAASPASETKNTVKTKSDTLKEPEVKYPGDLSLKDGTVLRKVSVLQVSKSKIVVADSVQANREVAVKDLTPESKHKLKL
ncbi:MAG: hypothetical protein AAF649_12665, partial [Verrucomicrobiota bacterium]